MKRARRPAKPTVVIDHNTFYSAPTKETLEAIRAITAVLDKLADHLTGNPSLVINTGKE